jgi:hypothetical protein
MALIHKPKSTKHTHLCQHCGQGWDCMELESKVKCVVTKAAKVNGEGPWCGLCMHLEMAIRYAGNFGRSEATIRLQYVKEALKGQ